MSLFAEQNTQEENDDALWLTSYADLISAILAVLVLMASFSKIDLEKFDAVQRARNGDNIETLAEIKERLTKIAIRNGISESVDMQVTQNGLGINFNSVMLFKSGSANLNSDALEESLKPIMVELAKVGKDRFVDIVGHTDDAPYSTWDGKNNWNLSAERAANLHKYMLSLGMPAQGSRLIAYADTMPLKPILMNYTEDKILEARQANRRVSVIVGFLK